jgi:Flp pilus assembly pilin Flp
MVPVKLWNRHTISRVPYAGRFGTLGIMNFSWKLLWADRRGQDMVEYALIGALVALAVGVAVAPIIASANETFRTVVRIVYRTAGTPTPLQARPPSPLQ